MTFNNTGIPTEETDEFGDVDSGNFIKIISVQELKKKGSINKKLIGKWVSVFFSATAGIYAIEMSCKHQGANLGDGKIENDIVTCPRHQWQYNILSGKSLTPNSPDLRKYAIRIKNDQVYISIRPLNRISNLSPIF